MSALVQEIIVALLVTGALGYFVIRFLRKRRCGNSSCGDCCSGGSGRQKLKK